MTYHAQHALRDVVRDLRDYAPLVDSLESEEAIDEGWPADRQKVPVVLRVQPVTETSAHMGPATERTFRIQFSVVARQQWRDDRPRPSHDMLELMSHVAERLDVSAGVHGADPGEGVGGSWQDVSGNRVALIQDWRVTVRPIRE